MMAVSSTQREIPSRPKYSPKTRRPAALEGADSPLPREPCRLQMLSPDKSGTGRRRVWVGKARPLSRREHGPPAETGARLFRPSISTVPQEQRKAPPRRQPRIPSGAVSIRCCRNRIRFLPRREQRRKAVRLLCNPVWQEQRAAHLYRHPPLLNGRGLSPSGRKPGSSRTLPEYRDRVALLPFVPARQEAETA